MKVDKNIDREERTVVTVWLNPLGEDNAVWAAASDHCLREAVRTIEAHMKARRGPSRGQS